MQELVEIIKLIATLGAQSKEAFIWYIVVSKGLTFLELLSLFGTIIYISNKFISNCGYENDFKELRNLLNLGGGYLVRSEVDAVKAWVRKQKG